MNLHIRHLTVKTLVAAAAVASVSLIAAGPAAARTGTTPTLLYDYNFAGTTGTVQNSAPGGPSVPLTLTGSWSSVTNGVHFAGNLTGKESVAAGKPASGDTLAEPASAAVGFGAVFEYNAPASGQCFTDTPNLTQIGRYGKHSAQAKLQLTSCSTSITQVMVECRFAGAKAAPANDEVVSTVPLVNKAEYNVNCVKSPDHTTGTTVTLNVTTVSTGKTVTTTATEPAMGKMRTAEYISVANKYPLPKPAANTSQFVGNMYKTAYCAGKQSQVTSCLSASLTS